MTDPTTPGPNPPGPIPPGPGRRATPPGRRSAGVARRVDVSVVLAVVLPLLCLVAVLLARPDQPPAPARPPATTALSRSTVVCPAPTGHGDTIALTSAAGGVHGQVRVGLGGTAAPVGIASGRVTTRAASGDAPVAVAGADQTAPGLVAALFADKDTAVASCRPPAPTEWFTGVGAGAGHTSVLELTNPDPGTAIADVTVYGPDGVVDAPRLRGVSVPGASTVRLDLSRLVPRRYELALEVVSARGRIGANLLDRIDPVGSAPLTQDWLPGQSTPARSNVLLGLAPGTVARRTLVVANGGPDEVDATVRVVSGRSVFSPEGMPTVRVPPQSVVRVSVSKVLGPLVKNGVTGLLVTGTSPVTATLRSYVGDDLSHAVGDPTVDPTVDRGATVLLPDRGNAARAALELAGATRAGVVRVVSSAASGRQLDSTRVEVSPQRGFSVDLPRGTRLVTVTPVRTAVTGAVILTDGGGTAVVPLTAPQMNGLVPQVRPGLP
jgi:hypothetical protein